jgi:hypothetical protein
MTTQSAVPNRLTKQLGEAQHGAHYWRFEAEATRTSIRSGTYAGDEFLAALAESRAVQFDALADALDAVAAGLRTRLEVALDIHSLQRQGRV